MDTDNSSHFVPPGLLFPPDANNYAFTGRNLISHPKRPTQTGMSVPGRSVATTRILVLEEHPLLRDGMTDFLNAQPDLHGMR